MIELLIAVAVLAPALAGVAAWFADANRAPWIAGAGQ